MVENDESPVESAAENVTDVPVAASAEEPVATVESIAEAEPGTAEEPGDPDGFVAEEPAAPDEPVAEEHAVSDEPASEASAVPDEAAADEAAAADEPVEEERGMPEEPLQEAGPGESVEEPWDPGITSCTNFAEDGVATEQPSVEDTVESAPEQAEPDECLVVESATEEAAATASTGTEEGPFPEVRPEELARLTASLSNHLERRDGTPAAAAGALCAWVVLAPQDLGLASIDESVVARLAAILAESGSEELPEAQVARLWLDALGSDGEASDAWARLAEGSLWEPMSALAYRALAHCGRRITLGRLLSKKAAWSVADAEAWLDAAVPSADFEKPTPKLESSEAPAGWLSLVEAERSGAESEPALRELLAASPAEPPLTQAQALASRLAARACVAFCRVRLGQGQGSGDFPRAEHAPWLPVWEKEYLAGLGRWQGEDLEGAEAALRRALQANPRQNAPRLALSALVTPEEALDLLEKAEPTYEILVARASSSARLGRLGDAQEALASAREDSTCLEPLRYAWPAGRLQYRRLAGCLETTLAEARGEWRAAREAWAAVCGTGIPRALGDARALYTDKLELDSLTPRQGWRRDQLRQSLARGAHRMGEVPLRGDALFFRALALRHLRPEASGKDLAALLRHRPWCDGERRAGGQRIGHSADMLARLGNDDAALTAWESSATKDGEVRRVLVRLRKSIASGSPDVASADGPWPKLMVAVGLICAGRFAEASRLATDAREGGASPVLCDAVVGVASSLERREPLRLEALDGSGLAGDLGVRLELCAGAGDLESRILAFAAQAGGAWVAECPVDARRAVGEAVASLCSAGDWGRAESLVSCAEAGGASWAPEIRTWMRVWRSLQSAVDGGHEAAARELQALETELLAGTQKGKR